MSPEWKYHITVKNPDWYAIRLWCEAVIGEFDQDWYKLGINPTQHIIDGLTQTTWYFKQEKHAILFKLRWA
jgi:hypothetical protein